MTKITIEKMHFFAHHGCFEEEQLIGTNFEVDVTIQTDTTEAEKTDDLSKTIDYQSVYVAIREEMDIPSKLLEHVGKRILDRLFFEFPAAEKIKLKISKLNPPVGGQVERVRIEMKRER
jgi:dihydroneopterin aldolase